jgi:general secretion pathway protein J
MRGERGFTLMEVLVAMVLLSLFAVVAYRALDAVLNIQRQAVVKMDRLNELAAAFAIIDKDLTNATTRVDPRIPGDGGLRALVRQDGAAQFDLLRLHPEDAEDGLQRTGYRCAGETLIRLVWQDINNPFDTPQESILVDGLGSCTFKYMSSGGQWLSVWQAQTGSLLPRAVELNVTESDGTPIRRVFAVQ